MTRSSSTTSSAKLAALVEINIGWLQQVLRLIQSIDDREFATPPASLRPHKAGAHLRHVLEFYECFLEGLAAGFVDYDSRRRDPSIETSRAAAAERIVSIVRRLRSVVQIQEDAPLQVRAEDADGLGLEDPYFASSSGRELLTLSSHTIHHFALIAVTLRAHGIEVGPDFGMAASTLRYHARRAEADAA